VNSRTKSKRHPASATAPAEGCPSSPSARWRAKAHDMDTQAASTKGMAMNAVRTGTTKQRQHL